MISSESPRIDLMDHILDVSYLGYFKSRFSQHLAFQIQAMVGGKNIHHTVLDEVASTFFVYLTCWRAIGSLELNQFPTTLKAFNGHCFQPYRLLKSFAMELKGKVVSVDIEVVGVPLDYNLLLGCSWFYAMSVVASSIFHILQFPHQGKIVTIDQLHYYTLDLHSSSVNNLHFLGQSDLSWISRISKVCMSTLG
jgi:hypothetical protein